MFQSTSRILQDLGFRRPTVLLDEGRARANIRRMAKRARAAGAVFRPHFKTHQSGAVAAWFREEGVDRIAVSSLDMADHFADLGWHDITVAVLHNPRETARAGELARRLADSGGQLGLVCDAATVAADLAQAMPAPTSLWLKVDTGYGRTGLPWDDAGPMQDVLQQCRGHVTPAGLLTHAGHSYHASGAAEVQAIATESLARLEAARDALPAFPLAISFGDTPCCNLAADLSACDEIRPGNFVFHDLMQLAIGACRPGDLAAALVCPVLGVYPERRQVVIHGGAVHLSKEYLTGENGRPEFGRLGAVTPTGLGAIDVDARLVSLSQEHGVVEFGGKEMPDLVPGDLVLVWPVHSCLVCDLQRDQMAVPATLGGRTPS